MCKGIMKDVFCIVESTNLDFTLSHSMSRVNDHSEDSMNMRVFFHIWTLPFVSKFYSVSMVSLIFSKCFDQQPSMPLIGNISQVGRSTIKQENGLVSLSWLERNQLWYPDQFVWPVSMWVSPSPKCFQELFWFKAMLTWNITCTRFDISLEAILVLTF